MMYYCVWKVEEIDMKLTWNMEDINTRQKMDLQISSPRVHLKNLVSALKTIGKNGYTPFHNLINGPQCANTAWWACADNDGPGTARASPGLTLLCMWRKTVKL